MNQPEILLIEDDEEIRRVLRTALIAAQYLTRIEYRLLEIPIGHADQAVTYSRLLKEVWGPSRNTEIHYLRMYILQLRRKLEPEPSRPRYLLTETGVGYRLVTQHMPEAWWRDISQKPKAHAV